MKTRQMGFVITVQLLLAGFAANIAGAQLLTVDTSPTGLTVNVDGTNYVAPVTFSWEVDSVHNLAAASPQVSGDGHSRSIFVAWSDGGDQSHSITMPASDTNYTATFATQYLLDTAVSPASAGTISNYPAGPWYDAGQAVSLTAMTNTGYRIYFWQGVDSAATNTAQVTMNGYRLAQATFLPFSYPYVIVTNGGGAAPGSLIGNIAGRTADATKTTYLVLDNTGTNVTYASTNNVLLRFVTPQGFATATASSSFRFKDESLTNVVDTFTTSGYTLDTHDVKILPNGHSFVFASETKVFDMSTVVPGGKTAASVLGNVVQELDASKRVVFEWHTFDHIAITNTFADMTQSSFDYAHINAMAIDPTDNNLLLSLRTTSEIVKVSRRTGQIIWRLGGKMNQFTFIGEHPENAPYYTIGQHDVHRLANGNLLYFDNGNISGGGVTPNDRTYSRMVEYALDETNMTATLVWEYRHTPDIQANCTGSLKRMANGNTFIDWGCAVPGSGFIVTEVNPAGEVVFEMKHRTNSGVGSVLLGGGLTKQLWNSPDLVRSATFQNVQSGQTYTAAVAGVTATINSLSGPAENTFAAQRLLDAVRLPQFAGKAPQVVMEHVVLSGSNIVTLDAELDLDLPDTSYVSDTPKIHDAAQVTVYHRPVPGQGQFSALTTTYTGGKLRVNTTQLGEFIFGYPDVAETPSTPAIYSPANQSEINQSAPVSLVWIPKGLIGSSELQASTNADFTNLALDTNGLGTTSFVLTNLLPNAQYYWRVRTVNQGGTSDWASASFITVPPILQVTVPAGGEVWQRFQAVTIQWIDNLSENIAIDIYKGGVSNRTIAASLASSGSYSWTVGQFQAFPPGSDYTLKIRSTANPALYDFSEPFNIVEPVRIVTTPAGLSVTVDGTNYAAPASFAWSPGSSHSISTTSPQVSSNGQSRYVFASWSDSGAQSHSIVGQLTAWTNTARFTTNHLLDISTTPPGAGVVTANPTGPWYDVGQVVALTANANAGYQCSTWAGVDSQIGNTAQLTMNAYRTAQAQFTAVPVIHADSLVMLSNGSVQFDLTALGATQATVLGSTNLSDWQELGAVMVTDGAAVFTDDEATNYVNRYYRLRVP